MQTVMNTSELEGVVLSALKEAVALPSQETILGLQSGFKSWYSTETALVMLVDDLWRSQLWGWDCEALFAVVPFLSLWMVPFSVRGYRRVSEGLVIPFFYLTSQC